MVKEAKGNMTRKTKDMMAAWEERYESLGVVLWLEPEEDGLELAIGPLTPPVMEGVVVADV